MDTTNGNGIRLENRLTRLEEGVDYVKKQVDNHIPTQIAEVQKTVDGLNGKMWAFIVTVVTILIGLVFSIIQG